MRQHDAPDNVADRPHALRRGSQVPIDDDAAALQLHAGLLSAEALCIRRATDGQQDLVGIDRAAFAALGEAHLQAALGLDDLGDLAVGVNRAADSGEVLRVDGDEVRVDHRQYLRQHLQHGDLAAQRGEHRGELHADDASADDREPLRHVLQLEDLVRVDGELGALERDA